MRKKLKLLGCALIFFSLHLSAKNPSLVHTTFSAIASDFIKAKEMKNRIAAAKILLSSAEYEKAEEFAVKALKEKLQSDKKNVLSTGFAQNDFFKGELTRLVEEPVQNRIEAYLNLLNIFKNHAKRVNHEKWPTMSLRKHVVDDLKLFFGSDNAELDTVLERIFGKELQTLSGKAVTSFRMRNPYVTAEPIKKKQARIKWLLENPEAAQKLKSMLEKVAEIEQEFFGSAKGGQRLDIKNWTFNNGHIPINLSKGKIDFINRKFGDHDSVMQALAVAPFLFAAQAIVVPPLMNQLYDYKHARVDLADLSRSGKKRFAPENPDKDQQEQLDRGYTGVPFIPIERPIFIDGKRRFGNGLNTIGNSKFVQAPLRGAAYTVQQVMAVLGWIKIPYATKIADWCADFRKNCPDINQMRGSIEREAGKFHFVQRMKLFNEWSSRHNVKEWFVFAVTLSIIAYQFNKLVVEVPKLLKAIFNTQASLIKIKQLNNLARELKNILPADLFGEVSFVEEFCSNSKCPRLQALLKKLDKKTFAGKASYRSYHGRIIQTFKMFERQKYKFTDLFVSLGELDCELACASLVAKEPINGNRFCLAEFSAEAKPELNGRGVWNPLIDRARVIANDLDLGGNVENYTPGALLSGPNAGGKSVFLRSFPIAAVLAQSFGIAPAEYFKIKPFQKINTSIDVKDDPSSGESLYSSECLRIDDSVIDVELEAANNHNVLVVGDEILRGTKHEYTGTLGRAILKKLARFNNVIFIVSSHNSEIIERSTQETNGRIKQIFVESIIDQDGFYAGSTNRVIAGTSPIDSAFFIAEKKFSKQNLDIVADAKEIYRREVMQKE